eukprot:CAMPEP_0178479716 /NCGR_PEP_ID=MMETSP0696-20121128/5324_1 /TAXON_ID=265572 /ORGANISM="Extubocellulus spinifer, Strain CCMP396" /LENGTH=78 /DNA_ID=CAMNT_0020107135 /DNA_START=78 /DNA_END=314 /DNA_ORIENTATION=+
MSKDDDNCPVNFGSSIADLEGRVAALAESHEKYKTDSEKKIKALEDFKNDAEPKIEKLTKFQTNTTKNVVGMVLFFLL